MSTKIDRVAILGRHEDSHVAEPMTSLVQHLTKAGITVLAGRDMSLELPVELFDEADLAAQADLMIAIGGDGTMLYAGSL